MDASTAVNLAGLSLTISIWPFITGSVALVSFGIGLAWLGFNVRRSIQSNIDQNNMNHKRLMEQSNINHERQMQAIEQQRKLTEHIICLTRIQLYAIGEPSYRYKGECERKEGVPG